LYVLALLILIALLAFFYLSQTSHVATQVGQMQTLEEQVQQLKRKNSAMRVEISAYEDMARIQREATAMGLAEPLEREYVVVWLDEPAAAPGTPVVPNGVTSMTGSTALAAVSLPAFWSGILQQFQSWVQGGWAPAQPLTR
jgi:cell division protein FtsL